MTYKPKHHVHRGHKISVLWGVGILVVIALIILIIFALAHGQKADTVIYGSIYTGTHGENTDEAIATKGDSIIYVGTKEGAQDYIDKASTRVFDYGDKTVMAGVTDSHTHINMATEMYEYQADIRAESSIEDYKEVLKEFIASHPDNAIYIGNGWSNDLFGEKGPTKEILDEVVPNKPVFIKSLDGHSGWVNSKMLELAGINKDTPDPSGGKIERDASGNPSGCLRETAIGVYIKPHLPTHSVEEYKELVKQAQEEYASLGYTAYVEIFTDTDDVNYSLYRAYEELDQSGELLLRVHAAWAVNNTPDAKEEIKKIAEYGRAAKGGMFELTDIKFFMDGVAETGTAFLSEPYLNDPTNYGLDRWAGEESEKLLIDCVVLANQNNLGAHFHAIGDAAVTKTLDVIEAAKKRYNHSNVRNVITHLELVKESDMPRFAELDVVAAANLTWGVKIPDTYKNVEVRNIGADRAANAYPYKALLDAGATLSFATDYPPGAFESPFLGFEVGVTRSFLEIAETVRNKAAAFTRDETLRIMTYGGAYQMNQENIRGTLEVGKKADLIVVDANILTIPIDETTIASSVLTVVNNKAVYPAVERD